MSSIALVPNTTRCTIERFEMDTEDIEEMIESASEIMALHCKSKDEGARHCAGCLDEWDEIEEWPCGYAKLAGYAYESLPRTGDSQ